MTEHPFDGLFTSISDPSFRHDSFGLEGKARRALRRRFSVEESTEDHFRTDQAEFFGAYGFIRKCLDYDFHAHYRKERQWLHDSIIEEFLLDNDNTDKKSPGPTWLILSVGVQGAGKRYTIEQLLQRQRLLLDAVVIIDTNEIRRYLPEFSSYDQVSPDLAAALTRKEAGYLAETLAIAALMQGRSVVFDSCLKYPDWYRTFVAKLRSNLSCLKVAMLHIRAETPIILERAHKRSKETGRTIQERTICATIQSIDESIHVLKPDVDVFFVIDNSNDQVLLDATWTDFTKAFLPLEAATIKRLEPPKQRTRSMMRRRFSALLSTEENHRSDEMTFYGKFAHIRRTLDYSYHCNYTFERQVFQDSVIEHFLKAAVLKDKNGELCTTPTEPWIVFTAGAMGAGKSYTKRKLVEKGRFPLLAFVNVDPDAIRQFLPEFHLYLEHSPLLAGELTRKEAGFMAEILTLAGLLAGKNVLVDGSLRDWNWYETYFARLRKDFPHLRIAILHVTAPREAVFQRAAERALATGRVVPEDVLVAALEQVPKSVEKLKGLVDYHCELRNAPNTPDIELVTPGETWESFQSKWVHERLQKKLSLLSDKSSSSVSEV